MITTPTSRGKTPKTPWTLAEREILREHYPIKTRSELVGLLPGRTPAMIGAAVGRLGLATKQSKSPAMPSTERIDAAIRRLYAKSPQPGDQQALARQIGRTRQWIYWRACALGVALAGNGGRVWTAEEDALLEAHAARHIGRIAKVLASHGYRRTMAAVGDRLRALGMSAREREDPDLMTASDVGLAMGISPKQVVARIERKGLKARRYNPAGGERSHWEITRRDLREWLIRSADWDHRRCQREWLVDILVNR